MLKKHIVSCIISDIYKYNPFTLTYVNVDENFVCSNKQLLVYTKNGDLQIANGVNQYKLALLVKFANEVENFGQLLNFMPPEVPEEPENSEHPDMVYFDFYIQTEQPLTSNSVHYFRGGYYLSGSNLLDLTVDEVELNVYHVSGKFIFDSQYQVMIYGIEGLSDFSSPYTYEDVKQLPNQHIIEGTLENPLIAIE